MELTSKIEAIKTISDWSERQIPLAECKELVEAIMALGVEDWKKDQFVKEQLALITKLNSEGE